MSQNVEVNRKFVLTLGAENQRLANELKRLKGGEEARDKACKHYLEVVEQFAQAEESLKSQIASKDAEIKRLEAENAELRVKADKFDSLTKGFQLPSEMYQPYVDRIALLESALGLPEGCDVFELQRAMKEGAWDAKGDLFKYEGCRSVNGWPTHVFSRQPQGKGYWFTHEGKQSQFDYPQEEIRLYCIKEAK